MENSVQDVPSSWVTKIEDNSYCYWPKDDAKASKLKKKCTPPQTDWKLVPCVVKKEVASFEEGRLACS